MKKLALLFSLLALTLMAFNPSGDSVRSTFTNGEESLKTDRISFTVRGNGKTLVKLGIGRAVGTGACCTGVSKDSYVNFTGEDGWVLWDSETKRVLTKVYPGMSGTTLDLRKYY